MKSDLKRLKLSLSKIKQSLEPGRLTPCDYAAWLRGDMNAEQLESFRNRERLQAEADVLRGVARSDPTPAEVELMTWLDEVLQTVSDMGKRDPGM